MTASADVTRNGLRYRLSNAWSFAHRWKGRILFAFLDQGLYSTTNFVLTVLYASWLPLDTFGRYVVIWTASLFIEAIQNSMIIDSLPAIVSRYGRQSRRRIDVAAFWVVAAFSLATSGLLAGAAALFSVLNSDYVLPVLVLALVNPLQRMYLFFRRLCYIRDRQGIASLAAAAYSLTLFAAAGTLAFYGAISVGAIIALPGLAAAAAISVIVTAGIGRLTWIRQAHVVWLAARIWNSGRWLAPAAIISWLMNWGIFPLTAAVGGVGTAGIVRALQNLLTPIVQFNSALSLAILPRVADKVADHGTAYARQFAIRATIGFTAVVLIYCAFILSAAPIILHALYRKPEIADSAFLLWPLAFGVVWEASRVASSMSLLAMRRTRIVFIARLVSLATFICGGWALGFQAGFVGILWGNALAMATGGAVVIAAAMRPSLSRAQAT